MRGWTEAVVRALQPPDRTVTPHCLAPGDQTRRHPRLRQLLSFPPRYQYISTSAGLGTVRCIEAVVLQSCGVRRAEMDIRAPFYTEAPAIALGIEFNEDESSFTVGTDNGFKIYDTATGKLIYDRGMV